MGFRDLAPIDSIIQVAGRINRENHKKRELSPLYIIDFTKENGISESTLIYDSLTRNQSIKALKNHKFIPEKNYLSLLENYYSDISEKEAFSEARSFYDSIKKLNYCGDKYSVCNFKIIEESPWTISVFIELNKEAILAKKSYTKLLCNEISKEEFDKKYKNIFNQYIIAVPEYYSRNLENINELSENIKIVSFNSISKYYDEKTGFKRDIVLEYSYTIL